MTRFKDFGDGGVVIVDPISFKIHGETFTCRPAIQGKLLLDMVGIASSDSGAEKASIIMGFLNKVLVDDSLTRFTEMLDSSDKIVNIETLGEITEWLIGEYSDRPQQGPDNSLSGQ